MDAVLFTTAADCKVCKGNNKSQSKLVKVIDICIIQFIRRDGLRENGVKMCASKILNSIEQCQQSHVY